jgi:hypothetical protein
MDIPANNIPEEQIMKSVSTVKRRVVQVLAICVLAGACGILVHAAGNGKIDGYTNTPLQPGGKWTVHDPRRPQPAIVTPGTASTQDTPGKAPSDAVVLFDGKDLSKFKPSNWTVKDGYVQVKGGQLTSIQEFGDVQVHVEWLASKDIKGSGQKRGNSGVFLMGRYEVQVLDCYENQTYPDGMTGSVYGQTPPQVNACRPQETWQSYDIIFTAPKFDGKKVVKPAFFTVLLNGVVVQNHTEVRGPCTWRNLAKYKPHGPTGPLSFQAHGNPMRYRNIWIRPLNPPTQKAPAAK